MTTPSKMRGRGWPLVILAAIGLLLAVAVLLPIGEIFAGQGDEIAQAQQDLGVYRAQIAARPRLEAELKVIAQQATPSDTLLRGDNASLAAASMQALVKALIERHGGQVRSAQSLAATAANGLEKISVQYELTVPVGGLKGATYELETAAPYLFLDAVEIRPEIYAGANAGAPSALHVQWTVHGYRQAARR